MTNKSYSTCMPTGMHDCLIGLSENAVGGLHVMSASHRINLGIYKEIKKKRHKQGYKHTLWQFNMAIENGPFIVSCPIQNDDVP